MCVCVQRQEVLAVLRWEASALLLAAGEENKKDRTHSDSLPLRQPKGILRVPVVPVTTNCYARVFWFSLFSCNCF